MARDKNNGKVTETVTTSTYEVKRKALHKMVESLIADKPEDAATQFHTYLRLKTREILIGESDDDDSDKDDKDEKEEEKEEKTEVTAKDDDGDGEVDKVEAKEEKKEEKEEKKVDEAINIIKSAGKKPPVDRGTSKDAEHLNPWPKGKINWNKQNKSKAPKRGDRAKYLDDDPNPPELDFANNGEMRTTIPRAPNYQATKELDGKIKGKIFTKE